MKEMMDHFRNRKVFLSNEVYEVLEDTIHVKKGDKVRLISGIDGNPKPGYHPSPGWKTVCRENATEPQYLGILASELKLMKE